MRSAQARIPTGRPTAPAITEDVFLRELIPRISS
jgi:hypothetical protein